MEKAEEVIERMLGVAPPEMAAAMVQAGAEVAIIGKDQASGRRSQLPNLLAAVKAGGLGAAWL